MLRLRTRVGLPRLVCGRGHLGGRCWGRRCVSGGGLLAGVEVEGEWGLGMRLVGGALSCVDGQKGVHVWLVGGEMRCFGHFWTGRRRVGGLWLVGCGDLAAVVFASIDSL